MSIRSHSYLIERGIFPGGGGGGGESTSTIVTVPPWATGYVKQYAELAYELWQGDTISSFSGTIIASQNADELEGIDGLATRGRYGDQVIVKAIAYLEKVINGLYPDGTDAEFLAALALVTGKSTSAFSGVSSRIGRKPYYTGDPDVTLLAQALSSVFPATYNARMEAAVYAENWLRERKIQHHGLGFGVEMGKHAAIDAEALRRAGLYQREYIQSTYALSHKLFVEEQELAVVKLEIFGNCLRALTGSQQTTTQQQEGNKLAQAVGMGVTGAAIGWMVGGPFGAFVGGAIGSIVGWFM